MSQEDRMDRHWLLIDGQPYCRVLGIEIGPPLLGRSQHRLRLDKPVSVSLLETRVFAVRMDVDHVVRFDAYADEDDETGMSILGAPDGWAPPADQQSRP